MHNDYRGYGMKVLYVTMGISGSGKSTLIKKYLEGRESNGLKPCTVICPDQIRKELTGSISDQSQNAKVFAVAYNRLREALKQGGIVIFDSTGLAGQTRKELLKIAHESDATACLWVLKDSANPELCRNRVIADIQGGVDRSDTQRQDIIDKMFQSYHRALENIDHEGWDHISYY